MYSYTCCYKYIYDVNRYWINTVGVEVISVYGRPRRTNNSVESFHKKFTAELGVHHPNIQVFLSECLPFIID